MYLEDLSIVNFKNFESLSIRFGNGINCFVGKNGAGKTNMLDAIHYLSMTKSATNTLDSANIRYGESFFVIKGAVLKNEAAYDVSCSLNNGKKILKVNNTEVTRLSNHIGFLPVVIISPADHELIYGGNESRRRYFDSAISQIDSDYLYSLVRYNRALKQRNSLLRQFSENQVIDKELLAPYDYELLTLGKIISARRKEYLSEFQPLLNTLYSQLCDVDESVAIEYDSIWLKKNPEVTYSMALDKDIALQRTSVGSHRDQLMFTINNHAIHRHGSQGQQKSFIVALKFAQFELLSQKKGSKPILLLDDIFDKLDEARMHYLMRMVTENSFGQIFLTDARPERTILILEKSTMNAEIFELKDNIPIRMDELLNEK